jgi:hypothetical protein
MRQSSCSDSFPLKAVEAGNAFNFYDLTFSQKLHVRCTNNSLLIVFLY